MSLCTKKKELLADKCLGKMGDGFLSEQAHFYVYHPSLATIAPWGTDPWSLHFTSVQYTV